MEPSVIFMSISVSADFDKLANSFHTPTALNSPHKQVIDTSVFVCVDASSKTFSFLLCVDASSKTFSFLCSQM